MNRNFLNLIKELVSEELFKREALLESPVNKSRQIILERKLNKMLGKKIDER